MRLSDVATIRTRFPEADFWLIRRGGASQVGRPVREYNPEHIGIKVERTDLMLPMFLFYSMENMWNQGAWAQLATGSLRLVNIKASDVKSLRL